MPLGLRAGEKGALLNDSMRLPSERPAGREISCDAVHADSEGRIITMLITKGFRGASFPRPKKGARGKSR